MPRLIGDIGGTNARFALCDTDGRIHDERKLAVADHPGLIEAARAYLDGRDVDDAVLAVATPVLGDAVAFTNSPWRFSIAQARESLGLRHLSVINDFVAQATAIPGLGAADLREVKRGERKPGKPVVVIGPGTGLGVAFLFPEGEGWRVVPSEGGHASFAPQDELQAEVLRRLWTIHGHVSAERLVSGPGLLQLARILAEIRGEAVQLDHPRQVSEKAAAGASPVCAEAIRIFSSMLGGVAGNCALTLLAEGGVYIMGGLCRTLGPLLDVGAIAAGFAAKGRFSGYLEGIPIQQVLRPHTGLLGAALHRHG